MRRTLLTRLGLIALALTVAAPALAAGPHKPKQGKAAVDLNIFAGSATHQETPTAVPQSGSVVHLSPVVHVDYKVMPQVRITLDWGMSWTQFSPDAGASEDDFILGNPVIGAHYLLLQRPNLSFSVGAGIGIPVISRSAAEGPTNTTEAGVELMNLEAATGVKGLLKSPIWMPETLTVLIPLHAHYHMHSGLTIAPALELLVFIPVGSGDYDTEFGLNFAADVGYDLGMIEPGLGLQLDYVPTAEGDNFQSALSLFVKARFGGAFARLRFLINLDSPRGTSFSDDKYWGLSLGGGAEF